MVSGVTNETANNADKASRTVASGKERKEEKAKRKLAEAVVSEVADKAISELCVSKVIDSLVKIGKIELHQLGRFNVPALLSMTAPLIGKCKIKERTFLLSPPNSDRPNRSRWRASKHIRC